MTDETLDARPDASRDKASPPGARSGVGAGSILPHLHRQVQVQIPVEREPGEEQLPG